MAVIEPGIAVSTADFGRGEQICAQRYAAVSVRARKVMAQTGRLRERRTPIRRAFFCGEGRNFMNRGAA